MTETKSSKCGDANVNHEEKNGVLSRPGGRHEAIDKLRHRVNAMISILNYSRSMNGTIIMSLFVIFLSTFGATVKWKKNGVTS